MVLYSFHINWGSFVGVYLGGVLYDAYGSYTTVWWIGIAVGVFSSLIHLPVREEPRVKILNKTSNDGV